jgi:DNA-binding transcriptional LysR family regulator
MPAHLDSGLLRVLVAVADAGSLSAATASLGRTQSAVSVQIARLEALAGEALFLRHARGVRLTRAGEALLVHARRVLSALAEAEAALAAAPLAGTVRIGVPEEYGAGRLPAVLARFAATHPRIEILLSCEPSAELEHALGRDELDLAVLVIDSGRQLGELLTYDPTVWVTSTRHAAHDAEPLPLAMFAQDCWWRGWALKALDDRGRAWRVACTSRSVAGIQAAVASGLAVAVLARSTMPEDSRILGEDEGYTELPGSALVLRRAATARSAAVDGMAAAIRGAFRQAP